MQKLIRDELLRYSTPQALEKVQRDIDQRNQRLEKTCKLLAAELARLTAALANIRQKKDKYYDSLMTRDFSAAERKRINERIDEFTLEEICLGQSTV